MFKQIFLTTALLACATMGRAQGILVPAQGEQSVSNSISEVVPKSVAFSLGVKGVGTYTMFDCSDVYDMPIDGSVGYGGGIAANLRFGKRALTKYATTGRFGVQLEGLYMLQNYKYNDEEATLTTYEVPLLLQWWFLRNLCVEVGPTFVGTICSDGYAYDYYSTVDLCNLSSKDIKLTVGLEYRTRCGFTASARYNLGTTELDKQFAAKLSTVSIGIGWMFTLVK